MTMTMEPPVKVALPKPDGDFYQMISTLSDGEQEVLKRVLRLHGKQGRAHHQQILGGGLFSIRAAAGNP